MRWPRSFNPDELPDGVYVGLPDHNYFAQRNRLGSTDMAKCLRGAADWWYASRHNPDREEPEGTDERHFGQALHLLVLEGDGPFEAKVVAKPSTYIDAKTGEEKPWNGNAKVCREWLAAVPDGCLVIPEKWVMRVRHMAALILNHPEYKGPLRAGVPEVSVLYHVDGQAMRARIDYLLPKYLLDLKSFGGHSKGDGPLDKALRIVANMDYDVQRYLYDRAREAMIGLIGEGQVYGATAEQEAWFQQLAAEPDWKWVWLFYQRRDDRLGHAPVVVPILRSRFDVTFETGREKVVEALKQYRSFVSRFGLDAPWADIRPMTEPSDTAFPPWLQLAVRDDAPTPEEEDA